LLPLISAMVSAVACDCRLAVAKQSTGVVFMAGPGWVVLGGIG
jgi:hypothetical protein